MGSESSSGGGAGGVWAQAWAQARAQAGPKLGAQKIQKIKILKIQIRSAQNVGKVWISRKKSPWPHLVPFQDIFRMGRKKKKKKNFTDTEKLARTPLGHRRATVQYPRPAS